MEISKIIPLLLGSSAMVAFITSYFNKLNQDKNIKIDNVTKERKEWREKIRELTKIVNEAYYQQKQAEILPLIAEFQIRLNPKDKYDIEIISTLHELTKEKNNTNNLIVEKFNSQIAFLLKHDWERIKEEIKPWLFRLFGKKEFIRQPFSEIQTYSSKPHYIKTSPLKTRLILFWYFTALAFSAGIIFFLSVGLTEPFKELVKIYNDVNINKSPNDWKQFIFWFVVAGSLWSGAYLWHKGSEKRFLEIWFKR